MLRINEAANRLGVTQTTLRRWEVQGRIHPVRTAGGERRYDEREIERLQLHRSTEQTAQHGRRDSRYSAEEQKADEPQYVTDDEPLSPAPLPSKPWEDAVHEARSGLQVRRIELERSELDRAAREATARREQKARSDARALQEQQARAQAEKSEAQRLASLRQQGDMIAAIAGAPMEYRAAVTRDLVSYVTAEQFPASAWAQAYQYLQARVDRTLQPWRDEQNKEKQRADRAQEEKRDDRACEVLIADGIARAEKEIVYWDEDAADEARRLIARELREEVESDWTPRDVVELVDEILDEWE
jgi:excisionase family DNA binding protein